RIQRRWRRLFEGGQGETSVPREGDAQTKCLCRGASRGVGFFAAWQVCRGLLGNQPAREEAVPRFCMLWRNRARRAAAAESYATGSAQESRGLRISSGTRV